MIPPCAFGHRTVKISSADRRFLRVWLFWLPPDKCYDRLSVGAAAGGVTGISCF